MQQAGRQASAGAGRAPAVTAWWERRSRSCPHPGGRASPRGCCTSGRPRPEAALTRPGAAGRRLRHMPGDAAGRPGLVHGRPAAGSPPPAVGSCGQRWPLWLMKPMGSWGVVLQVARAVRQEHHAVAAGPERSAQGRLAGRERRRRLAPGVGRLLACHPAGQQAQTARGGVGRAGRRADPAGARAHLPPPRVAAIWAAAAGPRRPPQLARLRQAAALLLSALPRTLLCSTSNSPTSRSPSHRCTTDLHYGEPRAARRQAAAKAEAPGRHAGGPPGAPLALLRPCCCCRRKMLQVLPANDGVQAWPGQGCATRWSRR